MDDITIRLNELHEVYQRLYKTREPPTAATVRVLIDRAAELVGEGGSNELERRVLGVIGMAGKIEESQVAWHLAVEHRVIDIRDAIDRLVGTDRVRRRGLTMLVLQRSNSAISSSESTSSG